MSGFTTKGKQYFDDGIPLPSVTAILNDAWPKQLTKWAAETVAGYAIDNWEVLSELPVSQRLREVEKSVWAKRDAAALRGTEIHTLGEKLVAGVEVAVPDEHLGPVEAYARFLEAWDVRPVVTERPILNRKHGYAGRPDLLAQLGDGHLWLLDIKTGKGVYESHVLQQAGYANAEIYLDESKTEQPWPRPERCGVVHVLADDVELLPLSVDARAFRTFLYIAEGAKYARDCSTANKEHRAWPVGRALVPPTAKPHLEAVQ